MKNIVPLKNTVLVLLAAALLPGCAFAIDGVILINQSTVMAAGGFPYVISQSGSYKLSGNLTMFTSDTGNHAGTDVAIGIAQNNVTLDLNGFPINIVNNIIGLTHNSYAITELASLTGTTILNGHIVLTGTGTMSNPVGGFHGIALRNSTFNSIENISVLTGGGLPSITGAGSVGLSAGKNSVVRRFITDDESGFPTCPSVVVETVGLLPGIGCASSLATLASLP